MNIKRKLEVICSEWPTLSSTIFMKFPFCKLTEIDNTHLPNFERQILVLYKGKSVPLQAWSGQEVSRKLRFSDYMTRAQDDCKVVSLMYRPPLPSENAPGLHLC